MRRLWTVLGIIATFLNYPSAGEGADTVKIAAIFAKTGDAAIENVYAFQGVSMAVEELNLKGGLLGKKIEVLEIDNQSTALSSRAAATKAVQEGVMAVIGASWSSHSLAMAPVLQQARIPMIATESTNKDVTAAGDYIFRVCFIDEFQGKVLASFARKDYNAKTAVVLTNVSANYSIDLAKVFMQAFRDQGGEILWEGDYQEDASDFSELLARVQILNPDVCFVPGYNRDSGLIMKQARSMGIKSEFLGADGWGQEAYAYGGAAIDGGCFTTQWDWGNKDEKAQLFGKEYKKKYGKEVMNGSAAASYDAVMLLNDAVSRAKSLDPTKIRAALAKTNGFMGVTGEITFDDKRNPMNKAAVIMKLANGGTVFVKTMKP